jgi:hypothetical protein
MSGIKSLVSVLLAVIAITLLASAGLRSARAQTQGCSVPIVDTDGDGICDELDNCPTVTNANQADADGDDIGDICDVCADSNLSETVLTGDCDSGVANATLDNGCTMADEINACAADARNHGQYVRCVSAKTNGWKREGLIRGVDRSRIVRCAAQSDIPGVR